jgi:glycosyltransferase involved in cell wall biosynthesis
MNKFTVAHFGARDHYELSIALNDAGMLDKLLTDYYSGTLVSKIFKKRYSKELPKSTVINNLFLYLKLMYVKNGYYAQRDRDLSIAAVNRSFNNDTNLFLYSYYAHEAFKRASISHPRKLKYLFQLHPHPREVVKILKEEIEKFPFATKSLSIEPEMNLSDAEMSNLLSEPLYADKCFVASSFTKSTLINQGIDRNKIIIVPYGVDTISYPKKIKYNINGDLNLLFVGQVVQRKGLIYLLEAIKALKTSRVNLTFATRSNIDELILEKYKGIVLFRIIRNLDNIQLSTLMRNSDLLVFPSLLEGFGHVILEAMASGLPVLCTMNTAGPDLFISGNEGFIVPIRDSRSISEKLNYILKDKKILVDMGIAARKTAETFTWQRFRQKIIINL